MSEKCLLGKVNCALHVVTEMELEHAEHQDINTEANYSFPLGHKVLCYIFDQYTEYTEQLLTIPQNDSQQILDYETSQNLTLKSLDSTCEWVQLKEDISPPNCTLSEIGDACAEYRLYEHKVMMINEFGQYIRKNPIIGYEPEISDMYGTTFGIPSSFKITVACII